MSYLRTGVKGCSKVRCVLAKRRLILDEMCLLYGKFASYLRCVLCKMHLIFPLINGSNVLYTLYSVKGSNSKQIKLYNVIQ